MSASQRNRAEGWKHAKLSGHSNETAILTLLQNNTDYRKQFLSRLGKPQCEIVDLRIGGLHETNVPCILPDERATKSKTDLWVKLDDGTTKNISIKKSTGGQVYLVSGKHFINGFEKQFACSIPDDVKTGINLFFGQNYDLVMDFWSVHNISPSTYEAKKRRLTYDSMSKTESSKKNADHLLEWFKDNIGEITCFCFARGLAANECDWSDYVWYKNTVDIRVNIDEIFNIDELVEKSIAKKDQIFYGSIGGGTTIQLPFGFVQWHFPGESKKRAKAVAEGQIFKEPGCLQFHHSFKKIQKLFE